MLVAYSSLSVSEWYDGDQDLDSLAKKPLDEEDIFLFTTCCIVQPSSRVKLIGATQTTTVSDSLLDNMLSCIQPDSRVTLSLAILRPVLDFPS